ncbi:MAG TPA: phosphotransferase, partial [Tepidiformaceae bacterium]
MSLEPNLPAPGLDAAHLARIDDALSRRGLARTGDPIPLPNSVLNQNFRVPAGDRDFVVRIHRPKTDSAKLDLEFRAIEFAGAHQIPVRPPLPAADGRYFHSSGGLFVSVYPWLDAVTARRGSITAEQSAAMGEMHGRIHLAFGSFADSALPTPNAAWDTEQSIADLSRVDDLIRYYPAPGDQLLRIQDGLRFKLELLESAAARPRIDFDALPVQSIHGDYHDGNVLFAPDGSVLAVIDWELVRLWPPVLELLRSLAFSQLLEPSLLRDYLRAYARHRQFSRAECEVGVEV